MASSHPPSAPGNGNGNGHEGEAQAAHDDESEPRYSGEFLYHTMSELRHEVAALRASFDAFSAETAAARQAMMTLTNAFAGFNARLDEIRAEMSAMVTAAASARYEAAEAATDARASRELLDEERRAAHRAGLGGQPLDSIPVPEERPTDPNMGRITTLPPDPKAT